MASHEGWLEKEGGGTLVKLKQRRYCVLKDGKVHYYKDKNDTDEKGFIDLRDISVMDTSDTGFAITGEKLPKDYRFWAATADDKKVWTAKLRAAAGGPTPAAAAAAPAAPAAKDENKDEGDAESLFVGAGRHRVSLEDFEQIRVIGKGSFGVVMQVRKKDTGEIFAIKEMSKEIIQRENLVDHIFAEKAILQRINHPYIVTLHYAFQTSAKLYLVLDFLSGGELFFHLSQVGTFDIQRAKVYTAEIGCAVGHLHSLDIIYRDLKPENAVLDREGHVCLTDFGLAKTNVQGAYAAQTFCGTPEYLAPEFLMGTGHGKAVDWWSLGILLYEMLCGIPPFYDENVNTMYELILQKPLSFPNPAEDPEATEVPEDAQDLCRRLLDRNPDTRMQSLEDFKAHPFFADLSFEDLMERKIPAPMKPSNNEEENFDGDFTSMDHQMGQQDGAAGGVQIPGFTYQGEGNGLQ